MTFERNCDSIYSYKFLIPAMKQVYYTMNQTLTSPRRRGFDLQGHLTAIRKILCDPDRLPLYFVLAAILTFTVEALSRRSPLAALIFLAESPLAFFTNYGIILLTLLFSLLFRKRTAGVALLSMVWLVLGVAQCIVLLSRVTPLTAVDIAIALSVITIISAYLTPVQIVLICLALVGIIVGLIVLFIRARKHSILWKKFLMAALPALAGFALVVWAGFATGQLSDHFPNLAPAYNDSGFPYCFGLSVVDKGVDRPIEYGKELITDILEELPTEDEDLPVAGEPEVQGPNIIFVQLESFFDVKYMEGVTFTEDPIPTFTRLKEQYPSGLFTVPVIGAGTVNTEFEVLSGMRVADFGAGEYPFRSIMTETTCETIAYDLLASGYRTHAIHNHEGSFYLRNDVYKNVGFESFTSIEYFENPTFNENDWAHDALLTDEILYILDSTEESDFVFAVSVQGHGKYPDEYTPAKDDILVTGGLDNEAVRSHYNYFINQLNEMDAFISALYEAVMEMDEDTVLVFYGDHLPSIARDEGVTLSTSDFETEYIIIANYETPNPLTDGDLFAYQLFPAVMEMIGNDEGVMNRFHRTYREDPQYLTLLAALEYDVLYGKRMAYGDTEYPVMTDMVMGSRPITVTGCYARGEYLYVKGTNFTKYSVVTLDGKHQQETEFVDATTLRVRLPNATEELAGLTSVTVRQISAKNDLLSETKPLILHPSRTNDPSPMSAARKRMERLFGTDLG